MPVTQPQIQSFLDYLQFEKRYSQHTLISYQTDLEQFFSFLEKEFGETSPAAVKPTYIRTWLATLKSDSLVSRSINRKISTLKSYFKYLLKRGVIQQTPMTTIISPKAGKRLPSFVEEKGTERLFEQQLHTTDEEPTWKQKTDKLILALFYQTGMRLSELIQLKEKHIDSYYGQIKVLGKGNKERIIPVSKELLQEIKEYINSKPVRLSEVDVVLINEKGKALYAKYLYNTVKTGLTGITTLEKKSPHVLRHTFATHLMNNGAELNAVKELLGHSSLAATQVYTHNTIEKLKDVFKKAHPKA